MKNGKAKAILGPTLALFLICLIATVLLALTNEATATKIEQTVFSETRTNGAEALIFSLPFKPVGAAIFPRSAAASR